MTKENIERKRLPPGQHITKKFPVLQKGEVIHVNREKYHLEIDGEVEYPIVYSLKELEVLKDKEISADIHCVTSWTKMNTRWGGISFKTLFNIVKPRDSAFFVKFTCLDKGFTTSVPIKQLYSENALIALEYENSPINDKHGGPVRAIIPDLYFYKSAKWINKITFLQNEELGYWETHGYSNKADPWKELRYSTDD
ncbi:MAG: molybdopterin-dependent oxidoreductase [Promethearchaeota archaeon]|jgi:DMSO/TMAO reductase YedYZ molybdopterin-dependent catalytic subunit